MSEERSGKERSKKERSGKKQFVLVLSEPTEGQQEAYHDYYEQLHLDEVLASTGWTSAQRFKLVDEAGQSCPLPYLALYETTAPQAGEPGAIEIMNNSRDQRQQSRSINKRTAAVWVFEEIGEQHTTPD